VGDGFDFWWDVAEYKFIKTKEVGTGKEGVFLTTGLPLGPCGAARRRYCPLEDYTGLFRTFAETEPTEVGILGFANNYGLLMRDNSNMHLGLSGESEATRIELPSNSKEPAIGEGEPLDLWQSEIYSMHLALILWDSSQNEDVETLGNYIESTVNGIYFKHKDKDVQPIATSTFHPELLQWFPTGDVIGPAFYLTSQYVNKYLSCLQQLRWDPVNPRRLSLCYTPDSLLEALWLQFALAVHRNKLYRRCQQCGIWFELSPDKARTSRLFCSGACRSKNYREKQAKAREMYKAGSTLENIAKALDTDTRTVQGWMETHGR